MFRFILNLFGFGKKDSSSAQLTRPFDESAPYWEQFKQKFLDLKGFTSYNRTPVDSPTHGYYSDQVGALVKQRRIPFRKNELISFLDQTEREVRSKNGSNVSFVYLAARDFPSFFRKERVENPAFKDNHYVSMSLSKNNDRIEMDYIDSNGNMMRKSDRKVLQSVYPDVKIFYRDRNFNRISEDKALSRVTNDQDSLLRLQHDDYSCGAYASEIVRIMKVANGSNTSAAYKESKIRKGLQDLKSLTPSQIRQRQNSELKLPSTQRRSNLADSLIQGSYMPQGASGANVTSRMDKVSSFVQSVETQKRSHIQGTAL